MASESGSDTRGPRHRFVRLAVVALGLAAGLGGAYLVMGRDDTGRKAVPSVKEFSFPSAPSVEVTAPPPAPDVDAEPAGPEAAVELVLRADADAQPERGHAVLDADGRRRYPTPASWAAALGSRLPPVSFEIVGAAAVIGSPDQATDVSVTVAHRPSLDPFAGLVPARSEQVWRAHRRDGGWRVAAEPIDVRLVLPSDHTAPEAVRAWVDAVATCDGDKAQALQAVTPLYGPVDLASAPCRHPGRWTVGQPLSLDRSSDTATLLAAFGADATTWARVVPVGGPTKPFLAAVAPVGETWRVVGVLNDSP
jgi:hypothetical protein